MAVLLASAATAFAGLQPSLPVPVHVGHAIASPGGKSYPVLVDDMIPEPDMIASKAELDRFFLRQEDRARVLAGPAVEVRTGSAVRTVHPAPRGLQGLPAAFFLQLLTGLFALLIAGWVWALAPRDPASILFGASGATTFMFTASAAIYSTREIALGETAFRLLAAINAAGSSAFGMAMIAMFLSYPRRILKLRTIALLLTPFALWTVATTSQQLPDRSFGTPLLTSLEMLGILLAIAGQFYMTRRDLVARAALTWLGLAVAIGAGAFILLQALPLAIGLNAPVDQGAAFPLFLVIYVGLALGLRQYRLFAARDWAYRVLLAGLGGALLLLLDAGLAMGLGFDTAPSLGVATLLTLLAYVPTRNILWRRFGGSRKPADHELFQAAIDVAFAPHSIDREARWQMLHRRVFDPLEIVEGTAATPEVIESGAGLTVPATATLPGLTLRHRSAGRRLFSPDDRRLVDELGALVARAEASLFAFQRGASEERQRIARDLHDDVCGRLLSGLHTADDAARVIFREVLGDIRALSSALSGDRPTVARLLADARYEAAGRLESASIALDWPIDLQSFEDGVLLEYSAAKALLSSLREGISNIIRHSGASSVRVSTSLEASLLIMLLADDGRGFDPERDRPGQGLKNIQQRVGTAGGTSTTARRDGWTELRIALPTVRGPKAPAEYKTAQA